MQPSAGQVFVTGPEEAFDAIRARLDELTAPRLTGRTGRIGSWDAVLGRDDNDRLVLDWRGELFDLGRAVVRHRGDASWVTFTVFDPDRPMTVNAVYPRARPTLRELAMDRLDFTADEHWTWEDGDFGLFVFNVATLNGPMKYRHLVASREPPTAAALAVDDDGIRRALGDVRPQAVRFDELTEIRAKFELSGIWSDMALIVFETPRDLAVIGVNTTHDEAFFETELLPRLRRLDGWGADNERALTEAIAYGRRHPEIGPTADERIEDWAEHPIWLSPS